MTVILIDPGHGLYRTQSGVWQYQRDEWDGYVEDLMTPFLAKYLKEELEAWGIQCYLTRPVPGSVMGESVGPSGYACWTEGACYHLEELVGNHPLYDDYGNTDRAKDLYARPFYAGFRNCKLAISLHSNGSDTNWDAHGVEVWHKNQDPVSKAWAQSTYERLVQYPDWDGQRGLKGDGDGWESNHAQRLWWFRFMPAEIPAILVEFLFHTNAEDRAMLMERANLKLAAKEIALAAIKYLEEAGRD